MRLFNLNRPWITLVVCLVLTPSIAAAADGWSEPKIKKILVNRIDDQVQSVGIVVGWIDEKQQIVVGHGQRGPDAQTPPDGDTVFEIGSVTKVFTGVLLADLARSGQVQLKDPVQEYLPEIARLPVLEERPITLYDLATHRSGLPRLPGNLAPKDPANPYADYSVESMYEFISETGPAREAGVEAEYSNLGMGLLGHVLALREEEDYETLVRERITNPLGMSATMISLTPELEKQMARGHNGDLQPVPNWEFQTLHGAGALRSTVHDMLKFIAANLGLVKTDLASAFRAARKPRLDFDASGTRIGLGWFTNTKFRRPIQWHNGETGGFHSFVGIDAERRQGVVVLSNSSNSIDDIGIHLLEPKFPLMTIESTAVADEIPATPAGVALREWIEASRSEDAEAAKTHYEASFAESFKQRVPLNAYMGFRVGVRTLLVGGKLERFVSHSDHDLVAYVENGGTWFAVQLEVASAEPHSIIGLLVQPTEPPND